MKITLKQAKKIIKNTNGRFFTVAFVKRTNNQIRVMNARLGVSKNVKGIGHRFDPASKGLIQVWDAQKGEHRFVPEESILWIRANGERYNVEFS